MRCKATYLILSAFLFFTASARANGSRTNRHLPYDTIYVTDFGVQPNSRQNVVASVQMALESCRGKKNSLLIFPKGRYDFWPQHAIEKTYFESNTTDNNPKRNAIFMQGIKNLTIDGCGSSFVYHDRMQPFTIDSCENIVVKNVSIDWDVPLTAQARVIDTTSEYIDIKIDQSQYPFIIEDSKLVFVGEGWKGAVTGVMEFEKKAHLIAYKTGDVPSALGRNWGQYKAELIGNGVIRLYNKFQRKPSLGNILVLRHNARDHAMIFITGSRNVGIEHVIGYHSAGLGILCQYSENLSFIDVAIVPNAKKGRYFSGHDDGMHFSNCKGSILVDSCRFEGLMDDPINIHGTYVRIIRKLSDTRLLCRFMEKMSIGMEWGRSGEEIAYINNHSLQTIGRGIIKTFRRIDDADFELTLASKIPEEAEIGSGLENLTWTPSAIIRNSYFGSCRARGILVTTPRPVLIENNTFQSSGSAILIAGDVNSWYESGACTDVLIQRNKFLPAVNTSEYQFTEAMISIFPEIPVMNASTPAYHKNIRILENEFYSFDYPVLFAQSVDGLRFENNKLFRSFDFAAYRKQKTTFTFSGCRNVSIENNWVDEELLGKNLDYHFMKKKDISLQKPFAFK